jgi:sugar-specific transcriptional regulator TrmB
MDRLFELLEELDFTQYEAQILESLIKYNVLSAREIHKYSGVPQPKIYETTVKLNQKGLINIIHRKKKLYMIKSKEAIQEILLDYSKSVQEKTKNCLEVIDKLYNTEEAEDIPFMGVAGEKQLKDYIFTLINSAKKSFTSFFPQIYYDKRIFSLLAQRSKDIDIKFILFNENLEMEVTEPHNIAFYKLKTPAFEIIKQVLINIENTLSPDQFEDHSFRILKGIALRLNEIFGIILIDDNKSFFKIPLPVKTPMAIISSLPELVEFHRNGIKAILASSEKL